MATYQYPDKLIKNVQNRIHTQLKGNGVSTDEITFDVKRQGLDSFTARTSYQIDCEVKTEKKSGQHQKGKLVPADQIKGEIDQYLQSVKDKKSFEQTVTEKIKSLADKGFGADKQPLILDEETQSFTSHQNCQNCNGKGTNDCMHCRATGRQDCRYCHHLGLMKCPACFGHGTVDVSGKQEPCHQCRGKGRILCPHCQGQKTITCPNCQGKGRFQCKGCEGQGKMSVIQTIKPQAILLSQINIQELEPEPKRMVSKATPLNLAKGGHIDIVTVNPPSDGPEAESNNKAWYEDEQVVDKSGVFYKADVPWAVIELTYKDKPYNISLIGKKGAIAEADNFMDAILKSPLENLRKAASGEGSVMEGLSQACKYRVSRETILNLKSSTAKKTMIKLSKTYSIGFSKKAIQDFVKTMRQAMKQATYKYRQFGYGGGLLTGLIVCGVWFGALRASYPNPIMDGGVIALAIATVFTGGFIGSKLGYKKLADQIIQSDKNQ